MKTVLTSQASCNGLRKHQWSSDHILRTTLLNDLLAKYPKVQTFIEYQLYVDLVLNSCGIEARTAQKEESLFPGSLKYSYVNNR